MIQEVTLYYYLLTYLLHGAESFLRSQPVNFAASQEIPGIYGTRKFLTVPTSDSLLLLNEIYIYVQLGKYFSN
jgi:hypothetical protein